jgi:hypothetical protein
LNGLMIAITSFMRACPVAAANDTRPRDLVVTHQRQTPCQNVAGSRQAAPAGVSSRTTRRCCRFFQHMMQKYAE